MTDSTHSTTVTVHTWQEDNWWIAQCLEFDVASQGISEEDALKNIREALELYFEEPRPSITPKVHTLELAVA
jgi:predicted RNase H-like HicB family nuclease